MQDHSRLVRFRPQRIEEIHTHEDLQKALWDKDGDVEAAALSLGCTAKTLYSYMDLYPEAKEVRNEARKHYRRTKVAKHEKLLEARAEQKNSLPTSFASIKYYLDTHGKEEGWGKQEDFTDEEVAVLRKLVENKIGPPPLPKE